MREDVHLIDVCEEDALIVTDAERKCDCCWPAEWRNLRHTEQLYTGHTHRPLPKTRDGCHNTER